MLNNYKIYYNDSFVLLTTDRAQMNKNFTTIIEGDKESTNFLCKAEILFDGKTNRTTLLLCERPGEVMCQFLDKVNIIVAGGGIVFNENGELLMIHRRGKWDLAKGKIELKEEILDGAVREVEEETSVKIETVLPQPVRTYHAYKLKGKNSLKETSWYEMKAKPNQFKLVPQTEEDIDEVRWVKTTDLKNYEAGCFWLIWDLISRYKE